MLPPRRISPLRLYQLPWKAALVCWASRAIRSAQVGHGRADDAHVDYPDIDTRDASTRELERSRSSQEILPSDENSRPRPAKGRWPSSSWTKVSNLFTETSHLHLVNLLETIEYADKSRQTFTSSPILSTYMPPYEYAPASKRLIPAAVGYERTQDISNANILIIDKGEGVRVRNSPNVRAHVTSSFAKRPLECQRKWTSSYNIITTRGIANSSRNRPDNLQSRCEEGAEQESQIVQDNALQDRRDTPEDADPTKIMERIQSLLGEVEELKKSLGDRSHASSPGLPVSTLQSGMVKGQYGQLVERGVQFTNEVAMFMNGLQKEIRSIPSLKKNVRENASRWTSRHVFSGMNHQTLNFKAGRALGVITLAHKSFRPLHKPFDPDAYLEKERARLEGKKKGRARGGKDTPKQRSSSTSPSTSSSTSPSRSSSTSPSRSPSPSPSPSPPVSTTDGKSAQDEMNEKSLLEELFPEASFAKRETYPKLELPKDAPLIRRSPSTPEKSRQEIVREALQTRGEQVAVLQLINCSTELTESDFRRLVPKGRHIEAWIRDGEFVKVIPGRDPLTLERMPFYYLIFRTVDAAKAYQLNVGRLHKLCGLHQSSSIMSAVPLPRGFLEDGEDMSAAISSYVLKPPRMLLRLNMVMQPYNPALRTLFAAGGYTPIVPTHDPVSKARTWKVLLYIDGWEPSPQDLYHIFTRHATDRGLTWPFAHGEYSIVRLRDSIKLRTKLHRLSSFNPRAANPDRHRSKSLDDAADDDASSSDLLTAALRAASTAGDEYPGADANMSQIVMNCVYNRWIVTFTEEQAAKRFARIWHRRVLPLPKMVTWKELEETRTVNTEFLW